MVDQDEKVIRRKKGRNEGKTVKRFARNTEEL